MQALCSYQESRFKQATELHCEPLFTCLLSATKVYTIFMYVRACAPPVYVFCHRSPLCTIVHSAAQQLGGAHRRSMVHNIVLYPRGGAQHSFHKPRWTNRRAAATKCIISPVGVKDGN